MVISHEFEVKSDENHHFHGKNPICCKNCTKIRPICPTYAIFAGGGSKIAQKHPFSVQITPIVSIFAKIVPIFAKNTPYYPIYAKYPLKTCKKRPFLAILA